ncbi:MAG: nucleotidyltransferase domain-containing protein [Bacteroidales bacterium]|jgi:predicted nucleotidyltransferase|nr:nucleotidyltransferase domain-containing protein [Bacteroidales bacterium]
MATDDIKQELKDITSAVIKNVEPEAIYLFGSYAYGTPRNDSDIDIYVVVPNNVADTSELNAKIHCIWSSTSLPTRNGYYRKNY